MALLCLRRWSGRKAAAARLRLPNGTQPLLMMVERLLAWLDADEGFEMRLARVARTVVWGELLEVILCEGFLAEAPNSQRLSGLRSLIGEAFGRVHVN